jgi:hypothetical protein
LIEEGIVTKESLHSACSFFSRKERTKARTKKGAALRATPRLAIRLFD